MRMRHKPYAKPELGETSFYIEEAKDYKGKWQSAFAKEQPIVLELGCGKGGFAASYASSNLDINYLAVDYLSDVLVQAKRKAEEMYEEKQLEINNIAMTPLDIQWIDTAFDTSDTVEKIYINFCNPWPKLRHNKRRLTHTRQLMQYREFLKKDGEVWFKTDDDELFTDSLEYFEESGFELRFISYDLHSDEPSWNIRTEYEEKFSQLGIKIKALIGVKREK